MKTHFLKKIGFAVLALAFLPIRAEAQTRCDFSSFSSSRESLEEFPLSIGWVPIRFPTTVTINRNQDAQKYHIFAQVDGDPKAIELASSISEKDGKVLSFSVDKVADDWWVYSNAIITILGCENGAIKSYGQTNTILTRPLYAGIFSTSVALILYIFVGQCVRSWEKDRGLRELPPVRYLDPVVVSSGPNGEGSISRLQVMFFSFIVFALALSIFLMAGKLSGVSTSLLLLMGISSGAAGGAKLIEGQKERLSFKNWAWLVDRKWLKSKGLAQDKIASWTDIVTSGDGVDVYRVQMFIFGLVVGLGLILKGVTDLSNFEIPPSMLELLGLSQVVYLGGKVVASPTYKEFDDELDKLQILESGFVDAALLPAATPSIDLKQAKTRAKKEYSAWAEQCSIVVKMFESLFGKIQDKADLEPNFPTQVDVGSAQ